MFPVEICNLCKIKWVTSCRCVYELETLWSQQLQWPDSNHKHHGSTELCRVTLFVMGFHHYEWMNVPYEFCGWFQMQSQWEITGSFWSSTVARRWRINIRNDTNHRRSLVEVISQNCSETRNHKFFWTSKHRSIGYCW